MRALPTSLEWLRMHMDKICSYNNGILGELIMARSDVTIQDTVQSDETNAKARKELVYIDQFVDKNLRPKAKQKFVALKIIIYVVLHLALTVLSGAVMRIDALSGLRELRGLITITQLMLSVLIVLSLHIKGFVAVCCMNTINVIATTVAIFKDADSFATNGLVTTVIGWIIVGLIVAYNRRINIEIERVSAKTTELQKANADLKLREEETKRQNSLLSEYNRAMKENTERLYQMNHYDNLTGLPNRAKLIDRMDLLISLLSNKNMPFGLIIFDLDNFSEINDTNGQKVGDELLQIVASRFKSLIDSEDLIGRWGEDEFAIIVQRQFTDEDMLNYVEKMRTSFSQKFVLESKEFSVTASFGVSFFPQDATSSSELVKCAETAIFKAKEYGRNSVQFFRREMKDDIMRKVKYESRLLNAIKNNELYLCFQPQYDMKERKLRGFEALCRWNSSKFGEVSPGEFIPVAESVGFIVPLGEWVLETACNTLIRLEKDMNWSGIMTVNISPVQLMSPMFLQSVKRILTKTGIDPKKLEFEVTESIMVSNVDYSVKILNELADLGISIALDDFGTGYSSLSYLQQLPIRVLKIDKSFVDELPIKENQRLMMGSIIGLVHQMDIRVVAEGVDDRRQLDILTKYQCDFVQGNIWGRPVMENEMEVLFAK